MSKPDWRDAVGAEPPEKMAVAYSVSPDGKTRVVAAGRGAEAEDIIARAQQAGVDVRRSPEEVQQLLQAEGEDSDSNIPSMIYELMAQVINFAQELNEQWLARDLEDADPEE